ncbi:MAG: ABC transporter ATP-binding protein [Lachnospiraceae bacterium]|nr:ABC transporter ATP-binding protein [Lachnospiraceae bacterium]
MENKEVLLTVKNLETHFPVKGSKKVVRAVDGVDLTVYRGETLGLVGESGCGKTTLGKSILQLVKPTGGEVFYYFPDGPKDLRKMKNRELDAARKNMQIVFQDPQSSLNPSFTIYGAMSDPLKKFGLKTKEERRKHVGDLLEEVNMHRDYMDRYPSEFSGGQRQRIGIARALSVDPELVVCDEAVSALDVSIQAQVLNLLNRLKQERNLTYIFISHNLSVIEYISDRIAVMYLGKIVELADADDLYRDELHPYTKALFSAIPVADIDYHKERILLEGDVPSPMNIPSGCRFHTRCQYCIEKCKTEDPEMKSYMIRGKEHQVACHRSDEFVEAALAKDQAAAPERPENPIAKAAREAEEAGEKAE